MIQKGKKMVLQQQTQKMVFQSGSMSYEFLQSGDIFRFLGGNIQINQFCGNPLEGSINNIYLRIYDKEGSRAFPLLGHASECQVETSRDKLYFKGTVEHIDYTVTFAYSKGNIWFWNVELEGQQGEADLIYGQDLGMADQGAVRTNELYMSQYLGHYLEKGARGYVVSSRQNQSQGGKFPYVQQGCLNAEIIRYSTDEMQFFGTEYKKTNVPKALCGDLEECNYQFELSYTALQTERFSVKGKKTVTFYGIFAEDHKTAVTGLEFTEEIQNAFQAIEWEQKAAEKVDAIPVIPEMGTPFCSDAFSEEEVQEYFPKRILEERENGTLLSFFGTDYRHVVLQEKELLVERPHGNIITTLPDEEQISRNLLTSTNYMYGLFHAQVVAGNTDMNKMSSVNRGLLNILKNTGQRIYIRLNGAYQVLTLPAAYELGTNYSRWYYKIEDDMLVVSSYSAAHEAAMVLTAESKRHKSYEFLITNQLAMGNMEFEEEIHMEEEPGKLIFAPNPKSNMAKTYPGISYTITYPKGMFQNSDDRILFQDEKPRNGTMLTMKTAGTGFQMVIHGNIDGTEETDKQQYHLETEQQKYREFYHKFTRGLHVEGEEPQEELEKLNALTTWYTHNALVHFAVPHGLEQCSGAAWGTRDICQGPMELFLVTGHFTLARNVLLEIYSHQFEESREWPQWFMFDRYPYQAGDCHGDVVFWPLKCIGDYLEYTNDRSILDEKLPYRQMDGRITAEKESVLEHIRHAVETIQHRYICDTALISYAGGDWDDTLQPADAAMKDKMVSAWTQALAYQVIGRLGQQLSGIDAEYSVKLIGMAQEIGRDFEAYLVKDGVTAGFAYLEDKENISYLLHPRDEKTGIHYRLLPLTRSIISGLSQKQEAEQNIALIREHLTFPDGVRLMDRPARYEGGVSRYFQRAEQAANVGREISLQYIHAHIRYIEAMSVYGDGEDAYRSLQKIVPIKQKDSVKNAKLRQSNAYFSSSEGEFYDRYQYQDEFDRLKTGTIDVKGGWRIYSSGPGIFLARWIGNLLGLLVKEQKIEIDPVLPNRLDGMKVQIECYGKEITFVLHTQGEHTFSGVEKLVCGGQEIPFERLQSKYRQGGAAVSKEVFLSCIEQGGGIVHIYK